MVPTLRIGLAHAPHLVWRLGLCDDVGHDALLGANDLRLHCQIALVPDASRSHRRRLPPTPRYPTPRKILKLFPSVHCR